MKSKILINVLAVLGLAMPAVNVRAQQPVPPDPQQVGPYTVSSSLEAGVRGVGVEGNVDAYRSMLNYEPGFRVFESNLRMDSEGGGDVFDNLFLSMSGWGGDPTGYFRANAEKGDVYVFDATVRRFEYFNALQNIALKQHTSDYTTSLGDFRLTLMPENDKFKVHLGYAYTRSEDAEDGISRSTFDFSRDEFPVFAPVRRRSDTYSAGFDAKLGDVNLSFLQGFRFTKDDTVYFIASTQQGNAGTVGPGFLSEFRRDDPIRGETSFTRVSGNTLIGGKVDVSGRFVYSNAETDSTFFQLSRGGNYLGQVVVADQFFAVGNAERPSYLFDVGVTWLATDDLTISNTFGGNFFEINTNLDEINTVLVHPVGAPAGTPQVHEVEFLVGTDYRRFVNLFEINYDFHPRFSAHIGHRYTDRRVEREEVELEPGHAGPVEPHLEEFDNRTNAFLFGFAARPFRWWSMYFDVEAGESDNAFTRISNSDYTNVRLRNRIRVNNELNLSFSGLVRQKDQPSLVDDETNIPIEFGVDLSHKTFTGSVEWTPNTKFFLASGYTYTNVTSDSQIIYFFNYGRREALAEYYQRDHFAFLNLNAQIHPRVSVFAGYRIHYDDGQGDRKSTLQDVLIASYPYQFQSPEVKVSVRLTDRLDWNVGYQYFDFQERFVNRQFYHAHLPYTSLRYHIGAR